MGSYFTNTFLDVSGSGGPPMSAGEAMLIGSGCTFTIRTDSRIHANAPSRYIGSIGCAGALACGLINSLGLPIVGDQWMTASFVFGCVSGLFTLFILLPHRHMAGQRRLEIMNPGFFLRIIK